MKHRSIALAALVVLIAVVFGGVATHSFITYDDPEYVTNNAVVHRGLTLDGIRYAFTTLAPYYWQPLTWLSLMADVSLWGVKAGPPLVENVVMHAIAALLLFFTFAKGTRNEWRSLALAAIWAIHPLRVESVAWVAERKDVLSTLFFIAAMLAYVHGRAVIPSVSEESGGRGAPYRPAPSLTLGMTTMFFLLAVMAKPMALTLPVALLLLDYWPLDRRPSFIDKIPLFAIAIAVLVPTFIGQTRAIGGIPLTTRLANAINSYLAYLGKHVIPNDLAVIYPYRNDFDARTVVVCLLVLIAITVAALMRKRYAAMGWLWYVITLVPVIGIVQVGAQSMADRFTYIPSIGLIAAVVWLIADLLPVRVAAAIGAIAIAIFAALSIRQVGYWRDSETLFTHALAVTENNVVAELSLGDAMQAQGNQADATKHYLEAARLSHGAPLPLAAAGAALVREQRLDEAIPLLKQALAANPNEPGVKENLKIAESGPTASVWNNRGVAYANQNDFANAEHAYQEAIKTDPKHYDAHMNYAALLSRGNQNTEALEQLEVAGRLQPSSVEPQIYRALVLANMGRREEAAAAAEDAKRVNAKASFDFFKKALHQDDANLDQFIAAMRAR